MQTIVITDVTGRNPVTIPVKPQLDREGACFDLIIVQQVHIGCPVSVRLSLRTDGNVAIWDTKFDGSGSHYAHVDPDMYAYGEPNAPTEAQRRTVARWWAGVERPCGLSGGVGKSLLDWAFIGMAMSDIKDRYLDGSLPALTVTDSEGHTERPIEDKTPWQKGDDSPL